MCLMSGKRRRKKKHRGVSLDHLVSLPSPQLTMLLEDEAISSLKAKLEEQAESLKRERSTADELREHLSKAQVEANQTLLGLCDKIDGVVNVSGETNGEVERTSQMTACLSERQAMSIPFLSMTKI